MDHSTRPSRALEGGRPALNSIVPHLWFDSQAEEAANFYVSVFPDSKLGPVTRYDRKVSEVAKRPEGSVMTVSFELRGQRFVALNGGPLFKFSEAVSFMVLCETQEELDHFWERLSEGGEIQYCGWLKDKYGLSWQIAPAKLESMMHDLDPAKCQRVMAQVMEMRKLDFGPIEDAYRG